MVDKEHPMPGANADRLKIPCRDVVAFLGHTGEANGGVSAVNQPSGDSAAGNPNERSFSDPEEWLDIRQDVSRQICKASGGIGIEPQLGDVDAKLMIEGSTGLTIGTREPVQVAIKALLAIWVFPDRQRCHVI